MPVRAREWSDRTSREQNIRETNRAWKQQFRALFVFAVMLSLATNGVQK
jgi:hypothetical protein